MESFFAALKTEHVHLAQFRTRAEAKAAVFEYIEVFYNRSSERTSRYVVDAKRLCCAGSGPAGCLERPLTCWTRARALGPLRTARLNTQGPSASG